LIRQVPPLLFRPGETPSSRSPFRKIFHSLCRPRSPQTPPKERFFQGNPRTPFHLPLRFFLHSLTSVLPRLRFFLIFLPAPPLCGLFPFPLQGPYWPKVYFLMRFFIFHKRHGSSDFGFLITDVSLTKGSFLSLTSTESSAAALPACP